LTRNRPEFGIDDDLALFGSFFAALRRLRASRAMRRSIPTTVRGRVLCAAHHLRPDSLPRDRLIALLRETEIKPDELVVADSPWGRRLANYWTARTRFIEAGRDVRPTADVRGMLAQVREPLLAVLRISPDFRPAYDPLLRMAGALARVDPPAARDLLTELQRVQPSRPEAALALRELGNSR